MNTAKRFIASSVVLGVIFMGVTNVQAGILMHDFASKNDSECTKRVDKVDNGIIVVALRSIFGDETVKNWFGKSDGATECGIIVTDSGIIVTD